MRKAKSWKRKKVKGAPPNPPIYLFLPTIAHPKCGKAFNVNK